MQEKKFLTVREAAEVASVSVRTVYTWIERQIFPEGIIAKPPGTGRVRFRADAFNKWLETGPEARPSQSTIR